MKITVKLDHMKCKMIIIIINEFYSNISENNNILK